MDRIINNCVDLVHKQLYPLHLESFYVSALAFELEELGFTVERESPVTLWYNTSNDNKKSLGTLRVDIVAHIGKQTYLIEVKHLNPTDANIENTSNQLETYLQLKPCDGGFFVFFPKNNQPPKVGWISGECLTPMEKM